MKRSGVTDLPLHYGRVPQWLGERMTRLGRAIAEVIVDQHGPDALLARLADPFWFQALGCVMGMDWHSSGVTTSVVGALKRAVNPIGRDLGLYVCGGRGKHSRRTPDELEAVAALHGLDGGALVRASRLSAKVDNTCVQDGFSLYLHTFVVTSAGQWAVVQQGMNPDLRLARRYHWHSAAVRTFVDDPQSGVVGEGQGLITNLSDSRAAGSRAGIVEFLHEHPERQMREVRRLVMDPAHQVGRRHVDEKRLAAVLTTAYERNVPEFTDALLLPGVGPRTMQALALVGEVIYGAPHRFDDPARFSFAHGGKDGSPFPVPLKVYDESIAFLRSALDRSAVERSEKLASLRKLTAFTEFVEQRYDRTVDTERVIQQERAMSPAYGGRTVFDQAVTKRHRPRKQSGPEQLSLFDSLSAGGHEGLV